MPSKSKSRSPYRFSYTDAIEGKELYNYFGNRVLESRTSGGRVVAVKVKSARGFARSEADMMHYASQQPGILAPHVLGCYDVEPRITVTVSDLVEGQSLDNVWHTMTKAERKSIKQQLKEQLRLFRQCTQPYIGRINRQETKNFYDRLEIHFMGPFESEEEFDSWCLERVKSPTAKKIWARLLPGMRGSGEQKFVLTHGDLAARNIMVKDGKITGIVGFSPSIWSMHLRL